MSDQKVLETRMIGGHRFIFSDAEPAGGYGSYGNYIRKRYELRHHLSASGMTGAFCVAEFSGADDAWRWAAEHQAVCDETGNCRGLIVVRLAAVVGETHYGFLVGAHAAKTMCGRKIPGSTPYRVAAPRRFDPGPVSCKPCAAKFARSYSRP